MKRVYVSEVVHEQLRREAKQQGRTLQWLTDEKLSRPLVEASTPAVNVQSDVHTPPAPAVEVGTWQEVGVPEPEIISEDWCEIHDMNFAQCKDLH